MNEVIIKLKTIVEAGNSTDVCLCIDNKINLLSIYYSPLHFHIHISTHILFCQLSNLTLSHITLEIK